MSNPVRVFISYAHNDSGVDYRVRVRELADRLREEGVECVIDQDFESVPPTKGWPRWMLDVVEQSRYVLVVCTDTYHRRFRANEAPGKGLGVTWEGGCIANELYASQGNQDKFIPIGFATHSDAGPHIPSPLRGYAYYNLEGNADYDKLYFRLTGHNLSAPRPLGNLRLPPLDPNAKPTPRTPKINQMRPALPGFVGRENEIKTLVANLKGGGQVCISGVHGMGGIGKTDLALQVAKELYEEYPDAHLLIDMQGVSDTPKSAEAAMIECITSLHPGHVLKLPEDPDKLKQEYITTLSKNRTLILLDNAKDEKQVQGLLPPPGSAVIVTSREHLAGLNSFELRVLSQEQAVELLTNLAKRKQFPSETAAQICKLCGHLPLAVRAAGSHLEVTKSLTPEAYKAQLQDETRRLELLKRGVPIGIAATLNLSYQGLDEPHQLLFRKLSVFPGTFAGNAEAAICEDPNNQLLQELERRSLVLFDEDTHRYRLHDLVRVFSKSLDEPSRFQTHHRHAEHYVAVLELAGQLYNQGHEKIFAGIELFRQEQHNITAAQSWSAEHQLSHDKIALLIVKFALMASHLLHLLLHAREQILWLGPALAATHRHNDLANEASVLNNLGGAYSDLGEVHKAIDFYEQALVINRQSGDVRGEGQTLNNLGSAFSHLGDVRKAIGFYEQALAINRQTGDIKGEGNTLGNLGNAYSDLGEVHKAIEFYEQALVINRQTGDVRTEGNTLTNLGSAYRDLVEVDNAIDFYEQALAIFRQTGDGRGQGQTLNNLGTAFSNLGEVHKAIEFYEQALVINRQTGDGRGEGQTLNNLGTAFSNLGEVHKAIELYEQSLLTKRQTGDIRGEAYTLFNISSTEYQRGQIQQAITRAEQSHTILTQIEDPNAPKVLSQINQWRAML